MTRKRNRICENCGKEFTTYVSEIKRGYGIFCSRSCAKKFNYKQKSTLICPTCNGPYATYINTTHCCIECQQHFKTN